MNGRGHGNGNVCGNARGGGGPAIGVVVVDRVAVRDGAG